MKFNLAVDSKGETLDVNMPKESYLKFEITMKDTAWLLFTPWEFEGLGGKPGEEYWVLGA
jgi:hypothetical protein